MSQTNAPQQQAPKKRRLAYVAGPYRDERGPYYVERNIREAEAVARELWSMGYAVICPHANTRHFDGPEIPPGAFIDGDLVMVERCDLIVFTPRWRESEGAVQEYTHAVKHHIDRYYWPDCCDVLKVDASKPGRELIDNHHVNYRAHIANLRHELEEGRKEAASLKGENDLLRQGLADWRKAAREAQAPLQAQIEALSKEAFDWHEKYEAERCAHEEAKSERPPNGDSSWRFAFNAEAEQHQTTKQALRETKAALKNARATAGELVRQIDAVRAAAKQQAKEFEATRERLADLAPAMAECGEDLVEVAAELTRAVETHEEATHFEQPSSPAESLGRVPDVEGGTAAVAPMPRNFRPGDVVTDSLGRRWRATHRVEPADDDPGDCGPVS